MHQGFLFDEAILKPVLLHLARREEMNGSLHVCMHAWTLLGFFGLKVWFGLGIPTEWMDIRVTEYIRRVHGVCCSYKSIKLNQTNQ